MPIQTCPSETELEAFANATLDDAASSKIASHLDACRTCSSLLDTIDAAEDTIVSLLRSPQADDAIEAEPTCQEALARLRSLEELLSAEQYQATSAVESLPQQVGQYRLMEQLGQGAGGEVYRAEHTSLQRTVALKLLRRSRIRDADAMQRFRREMKAVGQLDHPNIVQASDAGEIDDHCYLAMEFVNGVTLTKLLTVHGTFRVEDACELTRQTAVGLQHAHDRGLVHRDVKPSNLMLSGELRDTDRGDTLESTFSKASLKILDLGLALLDEQHVADVSELTSVGHVLGTVDYMSPEQVEDAHLVDARSDIYSLGATLFKLLTGRAPVAGKTTLLGKIHAIASGSVPAISSLRADLPPELVSIIHRMLAHDRTNRIATAETVATELQPFCTNADLASLLESVVTPGELARNERVRTAHTPTQQELQQPRRRQSGLWLFAGSLVLLLLCTILIRITTPNKEELSLSVPDGSNITVEHVSTDSAPSTLQGAIRAELPGSSRLVLGGAIVEAVLGESRLQHWGPIVSIAISPDGTTVASGSYDRTVRLSDTDTGAELHALAGHDGTVGSLAFSPDGAKLVTGGWERSVCLWDVASGRRLSKWIPPATTLQLVAFVDERPVAVTGRQSREITLWDVEKQESLATFPANLARVRRFALTADATKLISVGQPHDGEAVLQLFDVPSGKSYFESPAAMQLGQAAAFSPDGSLFAHLASTQKFALLGDAETGDVVTKFPAELVSTVNFNRDGDLLAVAGREATYVFDVNSGATHAVVPAEQAMVHALSFDPDSQLLATGGYESRVNLWNLETGQLHIEPKGHRGTMTCLAFSPDGTRLVTGGRDRQVIIWDVEQRTAVITLPTHTGELSAVAFSPDNTMIATASRSNTTTSQPGQIVLWDASSGESLSRLSGHRGTAAAIQFSHDGKQFLSADDRGTAIIWNTVSGTEQTVLPKQESEIQAIAFDTERRFVVLGTADGVAHLCDARDGSVISRKALHEDAITGLALTRDAKHLISAGGDDRVAVWDISAPEIETLVTAFAGDEGGVTSLTLRADGRQVAWTSYGGALRVWDLDKPSPKELIRGNKQGRHHTNYRFRQVTYSPDGKHLATANENGTAFVLNASDGMTRSAQ